MLRIVGRREDSADTQKQGDELISDSLCVAAKRCIRQRFHIDVYRYVDFSIYIDLCQYIIFSHTSCQ